jgi:hypothetical protein
MPIPFNPPALTIFDSLPPEIDDTFMRSLPIVATTSYQDREVLFAPNLQSVGCIDNSTSEAITTYSSTVTCGFEYSKSTAIGSEVNLEVSSEVIKAGFKLSLNITFTQQWSKSQTTEFSFQVPGGKKAYMYQGYLLSRTMRYDESTDKYFYLAETGRFVTNIFTTSEVPLLDSQQPALSN